MVCDCESERSIPSPLSFSHPQSVLVSSPPIVMEISCLRSGGKKCERRSRTGRKGGREPEEKNREEIFFNARDSVENALLL